MSACNVIQQEHAVHLITDGASYDMSGRVIRIGSKVVELPDARVAFTSRGTGGTWPLSLVNELAGATSLDEVLDRLPAATRLLHQIFKSMAKRPGNDDLEHFEITLIGWSGVRGQPECWCLGSHEIGDPTDDSVAAGLDGYEPYKPLEMMILSAAPGVSVSAVLGRQIASIEDVYAMDPEIDGLAIIEAQRAARYDVKSVPGLDQIHVVGGFAELTTATHNGISRTILKEWPDRIGHRIAA